MDPEMEFNESESVLDVSISGLNVSDSGLNVSNSGLNVSDSGPNESKTRPNAMLNALLSTPVQKPCRACGRPMLMNSDPLKTVCLRCKFSFSHAVMQHFLSRAAEVKSKPCSKCGIHIPMPMISDPLKTECCRCRDPEMEFSESDSGLNASDSGPNESKNCPNAMLNGLPSTAEVESKPCSTCGVHIPMPMISDPLKTECFRCRDPKMEFNESDSGPNVSDSGSSESKKHPNAKMSALLSTSPVLLKPCVTCGIPMAMFSDPLKTECFCCRILSEEYKKLKKKKTRRKRRLRRREKRLKRTRRSGREPTIRLVLENAFKKRGMRFKKREITPIQEEFFQHTKETRISLKRNRKKNVLDGPKATLSLHEIIEKLQQSALTKEEKPSDNQAPGISAEQETAQLLSKIHL